MRNKMKNRIRKLVASMMVLVTMMLAVSPISVSAATTSVIYRSHIQNIGDTNEVKDGATSGTVGRELRLENIRIRLSGVSGSIVYSVHCQDVGWLPYVSNGAMAGFQGLSRRVEAIRIYLTGDAAKKYDVYYRTHVQNIGFTQWVKNNAISGTTGQSLRVEAIEIKLVPKTGNTSNSSATRIALNVPSYKQTDSRWSGKKIGTKTIGSVGCLVTSLAMKQSYQNGTTVYPDEMKNKLSFDNNSVYWFSVKNLGYTYTGAYESNITNSMMKTIYQQLSAGKPVIIGGTNSSGGMHWVVVKGYNGSSTSSFSASNFTINDPNSTSRTNLQHFLNSYPMVERLIY